MPDFNPRTDIPTLEVLSPPVLDYPYFQNCGVGFDSKATDYSAANAWWLAEASFLVYGDAELIASSFANSPLLQREGMQWESIASVDDVTAVVMHNEHVAIVAFRGTRVLGLTDPLAFQKSLSPSFNDVVKDVKFLQVRCGEGQVHSGFASAFESIARDLTERLKPHLDAGRSIWFTGHSLGGALATLAAARVGLGERRSLYTFGCPRVGNAGFSAVFKDQRYFRVVHHDDVVARLPPPLTPGAFSRYAHPGRLVYIDADGEVTVDADPSRVTDFMEGRVDWSSFGNSFAKHLRDTLSIVTGPAPAQLVQVRAARSPITDHAPIYYATWLKEQLTA